MFNDAHHVLHYKKEWTLRDQAKDIRNYPSLIPTIPRQVHEEIHRNVPPVPLLGYHALMRVQRDWVRDRDTMQSIDNLLIAIEGASRHERAHPIERELALLAMEAIDLQRPYLKEVL